MCYIAECHKKVAAFGTLFLLQVKLIIDFILGPWLDRQEPACMDSTKAFEAVKLHHPILGSLPEVILLEEDYRAHRQLFYLFYR